MSSTKKVASKKNEKVIGELLREVIEHVIGKPAEEVSELLNNKKHVNEFLIAKKLDITINQTRNILYKISDHGLVSSVRKKDKKKGWYTYFWRIEVLKSLEFLRNILVEKVNQTEARINSRETKQFYICERCSIELSEENALLYNFSCNECGDIFTLKDDSKLIRELKRGLDKIKGKLDLVNEEVARENEKLDKAREKETKRLAKEKADKRAAAREARKKLAKKKVPKKTVKKKASKKKKVTKKKTSKRKLVKKKSSKKKTPKIKLAKKKVAKNKSKKK